MTHRTSLSQLFSFFDHCLRQHDVVVRVVITTIMEGVPQVGTFGTLKFMNCKCRLKSFNPSPALYSQVSGHCFGYFILCKVAGRHLPPRQGSLEHLFFTVRFQQELSYEVYLMFKLPTRCTKSCMVPIGPRCKAQNEACA